MSSRFTITGGSGITINPATSTCNSGTVITGSNLTMNMGPADPKAQAAEIRKGADRMRDGAAQMRQGAYQMETDAAIMDAEAAELEEGAKKGNSDVAIEKAGFIGNNDGGCKVYTNDLGGITINHVPMGSSTTTTTNTNGGTTTRIFGAWP